MDRDVAAQFLSALNKLNAGVARCAKALEVIAADSEADELVDAPRPEQKGSDADELVPRREPQQPF